MSIEQKINQKLNKYPGIKKSIKRIYQRTMYTISPKIKSEGNIVCVSPDDPKHEYFFGYYDKCPEDATGRYVLCLKADDTWSEAAPAAAAEILLIDTSKPENDSDRVKVIASTRTWNVQQGCMMQWLGPEFDHEIIYNDFRDGSFCSIILDVFSGAERVLAAPVYSVSADGSFALTLDFARLHRLRPGYGYSNILEETRNEKLPDAPAIWKLDISTNTVTPLLTYKDFASFELRPEMAGAEHKVNHIMLSPNGERFMVLHRWFDGQRKYTRLVTANTDGSGMYNLSDDDMVSHCYWKDDDTIIAFENKKGQGAGYYLMHDKTQRFERLWPEMTADGHPSCSPDGQLVVTDTYPNRARVATVKVMKGAQVQVVAKVFAPFKYDNDTRCDLHPRWSRDGEKVYIDSVFEGHRGLYRVAVPEILRKPTVKPAMSTKELVSCVIPSYKRCDTVTRAIDSVLAQTYQNIEVCIVDDNIPGDAYSQKLQEALQKYAGDPRVRYISQEKHINGAAARNAGIKAANGTFIAFLDDDDEWLPEKIERQMDAVQCDASIDGVTALWLQCRNGEVIKRCPPYTAERFQFKVFAREISVFSSTVLIRKSAIEGFDGFDERLFRHQDLQFLVDAAATSKFVVVQEYLTKLHVDSDVNRPDLEKFIDAKKRFFASVDKEFQKYSKQDRKRILNAHYYEVVFLAVKKRKIKETLQYLLRAGLDYYSIRDLIRRVKGRNKVRK